MALCGPCLPTRLHAQRGATLTVPTPIPLSTTPRFRAYSSMAPGVRPLRSIAKPWPGHTSTGNVCKRPSFPPIPGQRFCCFARLRIKAHSHWLGRFASSFHCVSVVQLRLSSGREKLILCFGRRESCGPGAHRDDERGWPVGKSSTTCVTVLVIWGGCIFGAGGGVTLCSPSQLWFLPTQQSSGDVG